MEWRELAVSDEVGGAGASVVRMVGLVHREILAHVEGDLTLECGGILLGRVDARGATITASRPVMVADVSLTHFVMDAGTWPGVWRGMNGSEVVGWYHSHPGHGVFLSERDRRTQEQWFRRAWHVAYVIDPVRGEEAVFCGQEGVRGELVVEAD